MQTTSSRRDFLAGLSACCAGGLFAGRSALAEDAQPETNIVRFAYAADTLCGAPVHFAKGLLEAEGFEFQRIDAPSALDGHTRMQRDEVDFSFDFASACIRSIDLGLPIKVLSGLHVGCYELFGSDNIRSIPDLRGKRVSAGLQAGSEERLFVSAMANYVGLDPVKDIEWVVDESATPMQLFIDGKVDAFLGFPPDVQEVRAKKVGHVVVSGALDRPWSQYFCCMMNCSSTYAERNPVATKHVLRAIVKAADLCVSDPAVVARSLVENGDAKDYDLALQVLSGIPYAAWRDYDPEDTMRFFSLRMHESGLIKSSPQAIIANGTDWRFLNELKRELKA